MEPLGPLKILSYRELKLVNENLFEGIQIILLIEYKHGLLVVNRIYRAKTQLKFSQRLNKNAPCMFK